MTPATPVLTTNPLGLEEIVFAKDQKPYLPLPAIRTDDGTVTSRWRLTWRERLRVLWSGSVWQMQWMGLDEWGQHRPLTPSALTATCPTFTQQG